MTKDDYVEVPKWFGRKPTNYKYRANGKCPVCKKSLAFKRLNAIYCSKKCNMVVLRKRYRKKKLEYLREYYKKVLKARRQKQRTFKHLDSQDSNQT